MAFTGVLGKVSLGTFALGRADAEIPTLDRVVSQTLVLSQTLGLIKTLNLAVNQTLTISQVAYPVKLGSANNTLTFSQSLSYLSGKFVTPNNTLAFSQSAISSLETTKNVYQGLSLTHLARKNLVKAMGFNQTLGLIQSAIGIAAKSANNSIVFSQSAVVALSKVARNNFVITQSIGLNTELLRDLHSVFGVYQTVVCGPNTLRRSLTSPIVFGQIALGINVKGIEQLLTFTHSVIVNKVRGGTNSLAFSQTVSKAATLNRTNRTQTFALRDTALVKKVKNVSANNVLAYTQQAKKLHIKFGVAENTLTLSQELVHSRYLETRTDALDLAQSADVTKIISRSVAQTLHLTHTLGLTKTTNLSIQHDLVFKSFHKKPVGFEGHEVEELLIPSALVTKVEPFVTLKGQHDTIVLPQPEFNDSDAFSGTLKILRSKNNVRRIYKKDTERRILDYTFVIQSKKYEELKDFIRKYNNLPFYLNNWRGELFYVLFNTNPFSFSEDAYWAENTVTGKNKITTTLTFEGVRLN